MENAKGATSTVLNKILIPVITTVLGATAIYFLGFNSKKSSGRSDMEKMLITKEATLKAWKSFVTAQNISFKNTNSVTEEYGEKITAEARQNGLGGIAPLINDFRDDLLRETKKNTQAIEGILKNEEDIDPDFVSMLNRTLDNTKEQEKKAKTLFDNLLAIIKSDRSEAEMQKKWQEEAEKIIAMDNKTEERAATEAEGIAKILAERYNQAFDLNELELYVDYKKGKNKNDNNDPAPTDPAAGKEYKEPSQSDPGNAENNNTEVTASLLTGEWEMTGGALELSKNGDMFWTFQNKGYTSGKWKLLDGKLQMNATNPDTGKKSLLVGFLSDVTQNSFTMTFMSDPKEVYHFKRIN